MGQGLRMGQDLLSYNAPNELKRMQFDFLSFENFWTFGSTHESTTPV